jgi:hypothetical protein
MPMKLVNESRGLTRGVMLCYRRVVVVGISIAVDIWTSLVVLWLLLKVA